MSNLDLWYCAGIALMGASFTYIVVSALQYMSADKKGPKLEGESNGPSMLFVRSVILAFVGIMVGAQFLQLHQDQQETSKQSLGKNMAITRALTANAKPADAAANLNSAMPTAGMGTRPTSRPERGSLGGNDSHAPVLSSKEVQDKPAPVSVVPVAPVPKTVTGPSK